MLEAPCVGFLRSITNFFIMVTIVFPPGIKSFSVAHLPMARSHGAFLQRKTAWNVEFPGPAMKNSHDTAQRRCFGVSMQADLQWHQFSGFNLGRWKGRALHFDPETGDYVQPYIIRDYVRYRKSSVLAK